MHEKIYEEFVERVTKEAETIKCGSQFDPETTQGPLISKEQMDKVLGYIDSGKKEGATLLTGGERHGSKGFHVKPTVFANVKQDMKIAREEIFGPVMSILKFGSPEEAIQMANDSSYGLVAGVHTKDIGKAIQISNALKAGQVWVNNYAGPQANTPFGGCKNSGMGRELVKQGLDAYLEWKTVIIARPEGSLP